MNNQMMNGGMPMNANMMPMSNGMNSNAAQQGRAVPEENNDQAIRQKLNTAIYDYLLRNEEWDVARAMVKSNSIKPSVESKKQKKASTSEDNDDDGPTEQDAKRPNDLPAAGDGFNKNNTTFLLEWYGMFWEMWFATKSSNAGLKHKSNANTAQFATLSAQHARQQAETRTGAMRNHMNNPAFQNAMMRNGVVAPEMQMRMAANRQNPAMRMNPAANANNMRAMMQQSPSMERAGTNEEANGQRVRTPSDGDNAPSPKRARMDTGNAFPQAGMVPNGRMAQMGGNPMMAGQGGNVMIPPHMMQANMNQQMAAFAANQAGQAMNNAPNANAGGPKAKQTLAVYQQGMVNNMRNNMSHIPNPQNMPSTPGGIEMAMNPQMGDFYAGQNIPVEMRGQPGAPLPPGIAPGPGGPGGNHALQDYQMQLMLLEQQNKKRLLMAKNENDGPNGNFASGMSPQGSRTGPSPNPDQQMKRDGSGPGARNSHSPMNFGMPGGEVLMKVENGMPVQPNGPMRPVTGAGQPYSAMNLSPAQLEAMSRSAGQAGRPNGVVWPTGQPGSVPMTAQNSQAPMQPGAQQRNAMPPPTTIPNNSANNAAARAASPAQSSTSISTPQTTNKANPKAKKETKGERKRAPKRSNTTTAATPGDNAAEPPQTPTSNVPQTPVVGAGFKGSEPGSNTKSTPAAPGPTNAVPNPNMQTPNQAVSQNPAQMANMAPPNSQPVPPPSLDEGTNLLGPITGLDVGSTMEFNLDYGADPVLGDFNFDEYMNADPMGDFDVNDMNFGAYEGLEIPNDA